MFAVKQRMFAVKQCFTANIVNGRKCEVNAAKEPPERASLANAGGAIIRQKWTICRIILYFR